MPATMGAMAMWETLAEHAVLIGAVVGVVISVGLLLVARLRRSRAGGKQIAPLMVSPAAPLPATEPVVHHDAAMLTAAVQEAETNGHMEKLPELYLSMARCEIEAGKTNEAEELLRKSILGAGSSQQKSVHAQARLTLGDLVHARGDFTTACEHWQIARALFHELKQPHEHEAVEGRMLRNGCPTDWVLTDF